MQRLFHCLKMNKKRLVVIVFSFLLLLFNSLISVQAVSNKPNSSTYVLRNDNLEITDIQYNITEDNKYKITVTANCVYTQYLHYCNLLYTYEVSDSTTDHLDWSDKNVELVQPTTHYGFTFVYDLVITDDCVIAVNLMEGSSGYVSKPVVVYLSDFPTEPVTEPVTESVTESVVKELFYIRWLLLSVISILCFMYFMKGVK